MKEEDSSFKLCVPGIVALQSPPNKAFRSTDTVGFLESELKKLLGMQQESRLWKLGSQEGRELLTRPEITVVEGEGYEVQRRLRHLPSPISVAQCLLLEEKGEMGNWPPE
ncbi:hCG2000612 [Homo sapiens]|uniref:Putative gametogenetin-binding protein 1 n=1 Tax=Homo sapiens TaxID=9606 RepID=GGNB1_HUMAN|nr:PUTATIVE PSEUDOGENE: RecName: Full=Putative gametogenetin-binding protein 1 [Homo sapiens]AAR26431.1 gametogenetin-binding protein 1 variant [Homo sapiens]EAX03743.1 hCG2000612 [Homo sapiens]